MKIEREISEHEYAGLHDVLYDLTSRNFTNKELDEIIEKLPLHIQAEGFAWGFDDTCVRDQVYVWYRDNILEEREKETLC